VYTTLITTNESNALASPHPTRYVPTLPLQGLPLRLKPHALIDHHPCSVTVGAELNIRPIAKEARAFAHRAGDFRVQVLIGDCHVILVRGPFRRSRAIGFRSPLSSISATTPSKPEP